MLLDENNARKSGGTDRKISGTELVILTVKAEAYDLLKRVEQQQQINAALSSQLGAANQKLSEEEALIKALLSVIFTGSHQKKLLDALGEIDKGLKEKALTLFEQMHKEQIHEQM